MQNKEAKGAKVWVSGRLDGADIARDDWFKDGKLPLNTLRSNIDYGVATARCTFGAIGIKVWIYKGDIFPKGNKTNSNN
jgi:small subunit ribosomal protein S3